MVRASGVKKWGWLGVLTLVEHVKNWLEEIDVFKIDDDEMIVYGQMAVILMKTNIQNNS